MKIKYDKLIISGSIIDEGYNYATFFECLNSDTLTFMICLSKNHNLNSYKILCKEENIVINYTPLWRKINHFLKKKKKEFFISRKNIRIFKQDEDLNIVFSIGSSMDNPATNFKIIENNSFGNRIKNKIIRNKSMGERLTIDKKRKYELKYGILQELIKNKNSIYECIGNNFFKDKFKFIILDSVNGGIGVRRWSGRVFKKRIDFSFNPDDFIKSYLKEDIFVFRL